MDTNLFARLESGLGYNDTRTGHITNPYVNFFNHSGAQALHETLASESVQMRGVECRYIRRDMPNIDYVLGECVNSRFEHAFRTVFYIQNFEGYEGERDFFGRYGMQVSDELTLGTTKQLFLHQVDGELPREGDLIYFPMGNALFEVTWVEGKLPFEQVGQNPILTITATKFIYSGESIDLKTKIGPAEIDPQDDELDFSQYVDIENGYFDDPVLTPVNNLNGLGDIKIDQYVVDRQFEEKVDEFLDPITKDPINGKGIPVPIPDSGPVPIEYESVFDNDF